MNFEYNGRRLYLGLISIKLFLNSEKLLMDIINFHHDILGQQSCKSFCIVFGSFFCRLWIILDRFWIVLVSFLCRFWIVFGSFLYLFGSFLHRFCVEGQNFAKCKKAIAQNKNFKNLVPCYITPSFDPERKYTQKTTLKLTNKRINKNIKKWDLGHPVYLASDKLSLGKSCSTDSMVYPVFLYLSLELFT